MRQVLKLYHVDKDLVLDGEMVDTLYDMLRDRDTQVRRLQKGTPRRAGGAGLRRVCVVVDVPRSHCSGAALHGRCLRN